jgi:hypothetical protein
VGVADQAGQVREAGDELNDRVRIKQERDLTPAASVGAAGGRSFIRWARRA